MRSSSNSKNRKYLFEYQLLVKHKEPNCMARVKDSPVENISELSKMLTTADESLTNAFWHWIPGTFYHSWHISITHAGCSLYGFCHQERASWATMSGIISTFIVSEKSGGCWFWRPFHGLREHWLFHLLPVALSGKMATQNSKKISSNESSPGRTDKARARGPFLVQLMPLSGMRVLHSQKHLVGFFWLSTVQNRITCPPLK